jgi:hypothetical protein
LGLFPGQFLRTSYSLFKVLTQEKAAEVAPSRCSEIPQLLFTLQVIPIVSLAKPFLMSKAIIWRTKPLVKVSMPFLMAITMLAAVM